MPQDKIIRQLQLVTIIITIVIAENNELISFYIFARRLQPHMRPESSTLP
jgi:hypothetical protein